MMGCQVASSGHWVRGVDEQGNAESTFAPDLPVYEHLPAPEYAPSRPDYNDVLRARPLLIARAALESNS